MMIANALAQSRRTLALHEPDPHLITEGYLRWKGEMTSDQVVARIKRKRRRLVEQVSTNGLVYIESSHYCSHLIPELAAYFDARFVFLHRDPRGFTKSGLARPNWYGPVDMTERFKGIIRRQFGVQVGHFWHDHRLDPPSQYTTRMEKLAWLWVEINEIILRDLADLAPERTYELALGDLGPGVFSSLLKFVGGETDDPDVLDAMITVAQRKPNKRKHKPAPKEAWDESAFCEITGAMAERLGYGVEMDA